MKSPNEVAFNRPFLSGKELKYIQEAVTGGTISGDGIFTKKCHAYFKENYGFHSCLLTTSCTDALEMSAILANISAGDEVIVPSFTFVSTANAFVLRGAKVVFADSTSEHPNISIHEILPLITSKTKVIVVVHYAGIAVDMNPILEVARQKGIFVIEDAAQAIDSFYYGKPLGSLGDFSAFSFHETKNITSGEGGLLVCNDAKNAARAEIVREKGTNRSAFFRGEINKYGWVDIGSSFLPSDIIAAFLYAQLENLRAIQDRRIFLWNRYYDGLKELGSAGLDKVALPIIPSFAKNNAHCMFLVCHSLEERTALINALRADEIGAVFHYQSLHKSEYYKDKHDGRTLKNADRYTDCLLRLPLYYSLTDQNADRVVSLIMDFYRKF